ncbi:MAG: magnesium transporter, partial [Myxococcaceae bacterium]
DWAGLREAFSDMDPADIAEILWDLPAVDSGILFRVLPRVQAAAAFEYLPLDQQTELVQTLGTGQLINVLNEMAPDDRTRLFEELPAEVTKRALTELRPEELKVARQLLGYPDRSAGRYMTPEYLAIRPTMKAEEALNYIRSHGKGRETLSIVYVTDEKGELLKDLRLASIVLAPPDMAIADIEDRQLISLMATADRTEVVSTFEKYDRVALPVTDSRGVLVGIITVDDVLDVAEEEATEDIQKMGGMEALEAPYLEVGLMKMVRKRGIWLAILCVSEMLTAIPMRYFDEEFKRAQVLMLFLPLIISSGGNSGSQATSLIIRALALRELTLRDWWRVLGRELRTGILLGVLLGTLGLIRILAWHYFHFDDFGEHHIRVAVTVAMTLIGVVLLGALTGAMLPFILRRVGLDPAAASAPFVATVVDVLGLMIYFWVAAAILLRVLGN